MASLGGLCLPCAVCRAGVLAAAECLAHWISTVFHLGFRDGSSRGPAPASPECACLGPRGLGESQPSRGTSLSQGADSPWPAGPPSRGFPRLANSTARRGGPSAEQQPCLRAVANESLWAEACSCGHCRLFCQLSILQGCPCGQHQTTPQHPHLAPLGHPSPQALTPWELPSLCLCPLQGSAHTYPSVSFPCSRSRYLLACLAWLVSSQ